MKVTNVELVIKHALAARARAYAPYSNFAVGAALLCRSGSIVSGANVENISFGLTMCAERVCIGSAVQAGERDFVVMAVMSESSVPVVPCGACRQVLAEFAPELRIVSCTTAGESVEFSLSELLPRPRQGMLG